MMNCSLHAKAIAALTLTSVSAAGLMAEPCLAGFTPVSRNNPLEVSFRDLPFIDSNPLAAESQIEVRFFLNSTDLFDFGERLTVELFNDEQFTSPVLFPGRGNQVQFFSFGSVDTIGVGGVVAFPNQMGAIRLTALDDTTVAIDGIFVQITTPNSRYGGFIDGLTVPAPATAPLLALAGLTTRGRRRK